MKKALLSMFLLLIGIAAFSQKFPVRNFKILQSAPMPVKPTPGGEMTQPVGVPLAVQTSFRVIEENIGTTAFDLQTANSLGRRIADLGDSKVSAVWHYGYEAPGFADRGTAYNYFDGNDWLPAPTERLEATRSGYPSFTSTDNGTEVVVSHKNTTATQWYLTAHTKSPGESSWTENVLPSIVPGGPVWGKVAAGGADGNTLHVLGVSVPVASGGVIYQGVENHPLYWRSTDAGQTWDKSDVVIPGLDSNFYNFVGGEAYQIEARGETVAVAVFDDWGDVALFKSVDNGESWSKTIIKDFPLDKHDNTGYTPNDIPLDPNAPDSIAILTSDAAGSLVLDHNGMAHVFFGWMYVEEYGGSRYYFPGMSGLAYWNENFATDELYTIADLQDFTGDTTVTITGTIAPYFSALTSHPTAGIDGDGSLYVVYSALHEAFINDVLNQNYRHLFLIKSEDGGANWSAPFDLINEETTDPDFLAQVEATFPSIPPTVGGALHLVYQQDFFPGLAAANVVEDNYIMYLKLDRQTFGTVNASEVENAATALVLSPNPAAGEVSVSYELKQATEVNMSLVSLLGERLFFSKKTAPAGQFSENIGLKNLASGVYFVRLETATGSKVERLIVLSN